MKQLEKFVLVVSVLLIAGMACSIPTIVIGSNESIRGTGDVIQATQAVSNFHSLRLSGIGHVYVEQGDTEGLVIEAEENLIPYFEIEVSQGTLDIGIRQGVNLRPLEPVNFFLTIQNLDEIQLSGSGGIEMGVFAGASLELILSGSGEIRIEQLAVSRLGTVLSGSGEIDLGGVVDHQKLTIGGSGEYRARELASTSADITISGSGSSVVFVEDELNVTISGSGNVRYAGDPNLRQSIPGSGSISHIDE